MNQKHFIFILLSLLLLLLLLLSYESKSQNILSKTGTYYPEVEQRSVIKGQIINFNELPDAPKNIELEVDDITIDYPHLFETEINDEGVFIFDFPLYHSMNSYLNYGSGRITPYLFPNDTLNMQCKIEKEGFKFSITEVKFDSKHDEFQKEFSIQQKWLYYNQLSSFHDKLPEDLTPEQFKKQLLDFKKVLLDRISKRVENDSLDKFLANYLTFSTEYSIYRNIIRFGEKNINNKKDRLEYLSFLDNVNIFNEEAMITNAYNTFLNRYSFAIEPFPKVFVESTGKTKEEVKLEMTSGIIVHCFNQRDRLWAEYLAARYLYNDIKREGTTPIEISIYQKLIKENFTEYYIRQLLSSMCNNANKKTKNEANLSIPENAILSKYDSESGEKVFDKILEDNKGKVIYIDIWATWCSPCIELFKHSHRMQETFDNENVVFVYLCCRSDEGKWKDVIKSHQLKGTHILLNRKQNDELQSKLSMNALPQFILIDSDGKIVNNHAPKPDSEEILNEIKKLL